MSIDLAGLGPRRRRSSRTSPTASRPVRCCGRSRSCRTSTRWVAMAQREVGERLAAGPAGTEKAGAREPARARTGCPRCSPSSPARWRSCERSRARSFIRCRTSTRSWSVCAGAGRRPTSSCARLVNGAFAHRRKTLAGSLALAGRGGDHPARAGAQRAGRLGHPADVRAERLSPEDFRALARLLEL